MTTDQFLQYLARHDTLREMEPTFTALLLRARMRQEAEDLASVTMIGATVPDPVPDLEAAG